MDYRVEVFFFNDKKSIDKFSRYNVFISSNLKRKDERLLALVIEEVFKDKRIKERDIDEAIFYNINTGEDVLLYVKDSKEKFFRLDR